MLSISFIVPTCNEIENLEACLDSVALFAKKRQLDYEIIAVDSGSTDGTTQTLLHRASQDSRIRPVLQKTRLGMGMALREAYEHCSKDLICHYECDCPFDLDFLDQGFELLEQADTDFVLGDRLGEREGLERNLFTGGYWLFLFLLFGVSYKTINFSYKLFRSSCLKNISLNSRRWFIDAELVLEVQRAGHKIKEIKIPYDYRTKGASKVRLYDVYDIFREAVIYFMARGRP